MVFTTLRRGDDHPNHCEDDLFYQKTDETIVAVVLDGCSSGKESHFASALVKKALVSLLDIKEDFFWTALKNRIKSLMYMLSLQDWDILTTIVFSRYNFKTKKLEIIFFGDGFYGTKGTAEDKYTITEVDEDNIPDYLAYHINDTDEQFNKYVNTRKRIVIENVDNYFIASDGLAKIKHPELNTLELLFDDRMNSVESKLTRKLNLLKRDKTSFGDDIGVILYETD